MTTEIVIKTKRGAKGGKSHKLDRSYKNRLSGKPARQRERTVVNKKKNIARNKANGDPLAGVSVPNPQKKHKK